MSLRIAYYVDTRNERGSVMSGSRITEVIPKFTVWATGTDKDVKLLVDSIKEHEGVDESYIAEGGRDEVGTHMVHVILTSRAGSSELLSLSAFLRHMA